MKKYIYFHICAIGCYERVLHHILTQLQSSDILTEIEEFRCFITGKTTEDIEKAHSILCVYHPCAVIHISDKEEALLAHERWTLHSLLHVCRKWSEEDQDHAILYLHSKGVSHNLDLHGCGIPDWITTMLCGLLSYRRLCLQYMERGTDVLGSYYSTEGQRPHFSGNYWWARSSHIGRRLSLIGPDYYDPEYWILSPPDTNAIAIMRDGHLHKTNFAECIPISQYLSDVSFTPLQPSQSQEIEIEILSSSIISIHIGLDHQWISCHVPCTMDPFPLSLSHLSSLDPLPGISKMVRIHTSDNQVRFFLENQWIQSKEQL